MTFSYDLATDVGKVRLLISDVTDAQHLFEDEEIEVFITIEGAVVLAAAKALEVIAANETMVQKRIQFLDLRTDGPAEATALLAIADRFRKTYEDSIVAAEDQGAGFEIVGLPIPVFAAEQMAWNELMELYTP